MKLRKHIKEYYLRKIKEGKLSKEDVANILDTSVTIVEEALNDFDKKKDYFQKKSSKNENGIGQILISVISTILVLLTLFEMQIARNATYMPDISLSKVEVAIEWDNQGNIYNVNKEINDSTLKIEQKNLITNTKFQMYNIGVGTAKDIILIWDHEKNMQQFIEALKKYEDIEVIYANNMVYIKTAVVSYGVGITKNQKFDFMLNSTQEYNTFILPIPYMNLFGELFVRTTKKEEFPTLFLDVYYTDIQGKSYYECIQLDVQLLHYLQNPDGSGFCTYNLIPTEEKKRMNSLFLYNINPDILMAVTSIFAVLISIISMIFTIMFSLLQIKHNKNSVRPISAIKINDYEDKISVKIHNVGTGPLLIKKLILKNDVVESSTLISMMPEVEQLWTTFTESVDGWTIPVGGKIILLEIQPESEKIRKIIRRELAKITVLLDYTDIYYTKFQDSRKLDFFASHES